MKKLAILAFAALAACTANEGVDADADDESKLAAQLKDYRASGPAVSCVPLRDLRSNRSAGEGAIVFEGTGGRLWVNRPPAGCPDMRFGRSLQIRTTGSQLCRGDIAVVFDPVSGMEFGGCGLGDFEPYRRDR
jgi:hypothetical protein